MFFFGEKNRHSKFNVNRRIDRQSEIFGFVEFSEKRFGSFTIDDFYLSNNNLKKVRSWETFGEKNKEKKPFYFDGNDIRRLNVQMKKTQSNFSLFFDEKVLQIFPN